MKISISFRHIVLKEHVLVGLTDSWGKKRIKQWQVKINTRWTVLCPSLQQTVTARSPLTIARRIVPLSHVTDVQCHHVLVVRA